MGELTLDTIRRQREEITDLRRQLEEARECMRRDAIDIANLQNDNADLSAEVEQLQETPATPMSNSLALEVLRDYVDPPDSGTTPTQDLARAAVRALWFVRVSILQRRHDALRKAVAAYLNADEDGAERYADLVRVFEGQSIYPICADCNTQMTLTPTCPNCTEWT